MEVKTEGNEELFIQQKLERKDAQRVPC
jgi:hypothetical protein